MMRPIRYILGAALVFGTALATVGAAPASASGVAGTAASAAVAPSIAALPAGVTAGVAVYDRQTGTFTEQTNVNLQFRSASVVKLLIALDYLWNLGPAYAVPSADRTRLDAMLRSSDDSAASYFWNTDGYEAVVNRMVPRLGLQNTAPPPTAQRETWGYTAITAADTIRVYRYILDSAPAAVRNLIMDDLRQSTRCGTDGFDQSFGIPSVFNRPWAVKQGWSGFGTSQNTCVATATTARQQQAAAIDLVGEALHTTGTVGDGDRSIVAVFTLHPDGTARATAAATVNALTRSLRVPGATLLNGTWFGTWGSGVRVRADATTASAVVGTVPAGADVLVQCQKLGQEVVIDPYRNAWWAYLPEYGGYMTNIYIDSPDNTLPGVPEC
jgi:hypothetical protein